MTHQEPYRGSTRTLVLAFDVGTTFSGIGYAILDPGEIPKIQAVTRFPGQENGDFKIPSILWYNPDGTVRAAGAEAHDPAIEAIAEEEGLVFVEWFKMHLAPRSMVPETRLLQRLLPLKKAVTDVLSDFLAYLFACAKKYITESHPSGDSLWQTARNSMEVVLSHPNGWEGLQQSKMRQAAVGAGIVPDTPAGRSRPDSTVMMVDAGGGTVDISTYRCTSSEPITLEELTRSDCLLQGSTFVTSRAEQYLSEKLSGSRYGGKEDIKAMVDAFDRSSKVTFRNSEDQVYIKFGGYRDHDPKLGISRGQLLLKGSTVSDFFKPSLEAITEAIKSQRQQATINVSTVFLTGGFAASPWLFDQLRKRLEPLDMRITRPDNHTNKAVAEGAVSFYIQHSVVARVVRWTYGSEMRTPYNSTDPEHLQRRATIQEDPSGLLYLPRAFAAMLCKGSRITKDQVIRKSLCQDWTELEVRSMSSRTASCAVTVYRGEKQRPGWIDIEPDKFEQLCTVRWQASSIPTEAKMGPKREYHRQNFDLVLSVGLTEMKAWVAWTQNGVERTTPAEIFYDEVEGLTSFAPRAPVQVDGLLWFLRSMHIQL